MMGKHSLRNLFKPDCCCRNYMSIQGGWNFLEDYNGNNTELPLPPPVPGIRRGSFNDGWSIGAALGRRINRAIRAEFEFALRDNTADSWEVNGVPAGDWSGHFYSYAIMTNLLHDFNKLSVHGWTPHVGGGIGIAFLDGDFQTSTLQLEVDDTEFAYQLIAGVTKQLHSRADFLVQYRYFGTTEYNLVNVTPVPAVDFGKDSYDAHNILFGLRVYR